MSNRLTDVMGWSILQPYDLSLCFMKTCVNVWWQDALPQVVLIPRVASKYCAS